MDLLGSILGSMEKPPAVKQTEKEKELRKKNSEIAKKIQEVEKERLTKYKEDITSSIKAFLANESVTRLPFPPMDKTKRRIVHDVVDITGCGLVAHSFGIEDIDRHVMVFKEQDIPNDDELEALKKGEVYDPEKIRLKRLQEEEEAKSAKKTKIEPATNYKEKYQHLIGLSAGKSAATVTTANAKFGYVPSENKKDQRSIEQTLKDIREKKRKRDDDEDH